MRWLLIVLMVLGAWAMPTPACASCTTETVVIGDKVVVCTVCCNGPYGCISQCF